MKKQHWMLAAILVLVASFTNAQTVEYIHTDELGSPVAVTNASGAVIERTVYEPYGAVINRPVTNGPGYTGHVMDAVTGLNYMQQRYYDPQVGRLLSVDPVNVDTAKGWNFNRYNYAGNNPYKYIDPDGEKLEFAQGSTPAFKQSFADIVKYHNKHGTSGTFARLQKAQDIITIKEAKNPHDFYYDPSTKTIVFDPNSGLEVAPGKVQTPALGVLHEAGHAENDVNNSTQAAQDHATADPQYGNVEDKKVIQGVETPAANKIGEPTRTSHGGTPVKVSCPTCDK